jgi:hypothetical protein
MHPLVRDLYKRVLLAGRDYPTGIDHVKVVWKQAMQNPRHCPSCYDSPSDSNKKDDKIRRTPPLSGHHNYPDKLDHSQESSEAALCEREIRQAVARGRLMVNEMIGVARLRKYRTMKERYGGDGAGAKDGAGTVDDATDVVPSNHRHAGDDFHGSSEEARGACPR